MTPEHIAALSDRLCGQGVEFRPADLETFASGLPPQLEGDSDIEALTARFIEANRFYATQAKRQKRASHTLRDGLLLLAAAGVCLTISASAFGLIFLLDLPPAGPLSLVLSLLVCTWILAAIFAFGGLMFLLPGSLSLTWSRLRLWIRFGKMSSDNDRRED
jgi:hypothetical protein